MSINKEVYTPLEIEEELLEPTEYTGVDYDEPVYSLPLKPGWEGIEQYQAESLLSQPYAPSVDTFQPTTFEPARKEIVSQTNITEVTRVVETIYEESDFVPEQFPPMEFQAAMPETYGTMGYFAILLSILMFGMIPSQDEMY